jgi:drug/metabolite transporter superfamily protein YnfA
MKTRRFNPLFGCFKNLSRMQSRKWLVMGLTVLLAFTSLAWISPAQRSVGPGLVERAHATTTIVALKTGTATPAYYLNTGTPMPADWVNNAQQTNSIVVGAIILVLIVLVGTLTSLRTKK